MQIRVTIPDERADEINAQLAEEAMQRGLDLEHYLTEKLVASRAGVEPRHWSASEAVDEIRRLRRGNRLNGISIKDLINEGRRY